MLTVAASFPLSQASVMLSRLSSKMPCAFLVSICHWLCPAHRIPAALEGCWQVLHWPSHSLCSICGACFVFVCRWIIHHTAVVLAPLSCASGWYVQSIRPGFSSWLQCLLTQFCPRPPCWWFNHASGCPRIYLRKRIWNCSSCFRCPRCKLCLTSIHETSEDYGLVYLQLCGLAIVMLFQNSHLQYAKSLTCLANFGIDLFVQGSITGDDIAKIYEVFYCLQLCSINAHWSGTCSGIKSGLQQNLSLV